MATETETRKKPEVLGRVTHFFGHIGVASVRFNRNIRLGAYVRFLGPHTDFAEAITSMECEHRPITEAGRGQEVGVRVYDRGREGDLIIAAGKDDVSDSDGE